MRKLIKKLSVLSVAAVLAAGTLSLAACGGGSVKITPDTSATGESVTSNGGFVVTTGEYYYFINGVEAYTAENTYGKVVKGALMREKKSDLKAGKNTAETVVPSLITSSDYNSGIYIYGEGANARVYYATPNNVKNTSGEVESDYLDFKSAKLDGTDVKQYFHATQNSTVFRFVPVNGTVYILYVDGSDLHSYNTASGVDTQLVTSMGAYVFNSDDKTDPYVYYTMPVKGWIDTEGGGSEYSYNQIYRVKADATEAAHKIEFDKDWVENENDGKEPYQNFGSIVLDGIGSTDEEFDTRFSPDYDGTVNLPTMGYSYTLQSYANGGIYFTRSVINAESSGLYYLSADSITASWNSIAGNSVSTTGSDGYLDMVASKGNASNAGTAAIFYIERNATENTKHHYLYVSGSSIYRADVINDGTGLNVKHGKAGAEGDLQIAYDESGATLTCLDRTSDSAYSYLYYTKSSGGGNSVNRVAYNGVESNYANLNYGSGANEEDNENFKTTSLAGVEHASSWYNFEILDNTLFYANSETVASTSYNYIYTYELKNESGKLMNAAELEKVNDRYNLVMGKDDGYLAKVTKDYSNLSNPIKYYFYTGKADQFWTNIKNAEELGKKNTYLYKEDEQKIFKAFSEGSDVEFVEGLNGDGVKYRTQSAFITMIGVKSEEDIKTETEYWETALAHYTPAEEDEGLAWWAWLLIGLAIAIVVAGATVTTVLLVLKKKKKGQEKPVHKMAVDTTDDDKDIDVYAVNDAKKDEPEEAEEAPAEEQPKAEEPAEAVEEPAKAAEIPAEEEAPETPAEAVEQPAPEEKTETPEE